MHGTYLDPIALLRDHGLKATAGRTRLLEILRAERKPASIERLQRKLKGAMNEVTLYRALEALEAARIVSRSDLGHGHAHYELVIGRPHHHHAVCRGCGYVEDIEVTHSPKPVAEARRKTKGFRAIDSYTFDFFGLCTACA